jgi:copper transport protein
MGALGREQSSAGLRQAALVANLQIVKRLNIARPIAAGLGLIALLATPVVLYAHAKLLRSSPTEGSTLQAPPGELGFWFSEKPELPFTVIKLTDSAGVVVAIGSPTAADSMGVRVPVTGPMHAGRYEVSWRTAASDGHASEGKIHFILAQGSAAATTTPPVSPGAQITIDTTRTGPSSNSVVTLGPPTPFTMSMRWVELIGLLTTIGLIIFRLAVLAAAKWPQDIAAESSDRAVRLARATLVLFIVATLSRGFAKADMLNVVTESRMHALQTMVMNTTWGYGWAIGFVGAIVGLIALLFPGKRIPIGWIIASVGVVCACLSESLTGHAGASRRFALAVAADVAHVLGAGGWLGALVAVVLCALPVLKRLDGSRQSELGSRLLRAYHSSAVESVTIVVASGLVSSWLRLPSFDALWTTDYGSMLFRKLVFVLVALGLGLYHWRKFVIPAWESNTRGRFLRTATIELVFGAIIIAITSILVGMPRV